ncbi:TPA: ASCH domain-containing protein [Burkholderia cenocepacia]|nr:ASCH domain-containing protein [Burkholderia cenocepacia]
MRTLTLALKGIYFDQIAAGTKDEEFRLVTPFWQKRLLNRTYDRIVLTRGYPKTSDTSRRIELPWRGFVTRTITHPHFGPDPVEVFAIRVGARAGAAHE